MRVADAKKATSPATKRARRPRQATPAAAEPAPAPPPKPPRKPRGAPAIATNGLTKRFKNGVLAVDNLSFEVPTGAVVGFVGPNGSGKTTTIRMLMGLIKPTSGDADVLDQPISHPAAFLPDTGALIEEPAFYPALDGRRNLLVHCRLRGISPDRIDPVIAAVGLEDAVRRAVGGYSQGMRKRLAIAAALLPNPKLLVLDEPANGLDPMGMRDVRQLLRHLADQGRTVFVSSHLLSEVEQACDEVVVIQKGKLIFQGPLDDLLENDQAELIVAAEDPAHHRVIRELCSKAGYAAEQRGDRVFIRAPAIFAAELNRESMAAGVTLVELRRERLDLEQVFFDLTGETANATEGQEVSA